MRGTIADWHWNSHMTRAMVKREIGALGTILSEPAQDGVCPGEALDVAAERVQEKSSRRSEVWCTEGTLQNAP